MPVDNHAQGDEGEKQVEIWKIKRVSRRCRAAAAPGNIQGMPAS